MKNINQMLKQAQNLKTQMDDVQKRLGTLNL